MVKPGAKKGRGKVNVTIQFKQILNEEKKEERMKHNYSYIIIIINRV
jgi:hypothetical protein